MRNFVFIPVLALLLWGAASAAEPVRLAVILPKSGPLATVQTRKYTAPGAMLAVEEINAQGGLLGRVVELVEFDSKGTALGARAAALQALAVHPIAVIGDRASTMSLAIAPLMQQARVPMISPSSTHPDLTRIGDYIFRVCYTDAVQGDALAGFAVTDLRARRVVVLTNASLKNSVELSQRFSQAVRSRGGNVLLELDYLGDSSDFRAQLDKVQALAPDLLFLSGGSEDSGTLMQQARARGLAAQFLGGDAWNQDIYRFSGAAINGAYSAAQWHQAMPTPASRGFVKRFETRYGEARGHGEALSYDAVLVLADAVRRAGTFEAAAVRDALAHTRALAGVSGAITLDVERNAVKPVVILRHQGGKSSFVKAIGPVAPAGPAQSIRGGRIDLLD